MAGMPWAEPGGRRGRGGRPGRGNDIGQAQQEKTSRFLSKQRKLRRFPLSYTVSLESLRNVAPFAELRADDRATSSQKSVDPSGPGSSVTVCGSLLYKVHEQCPFAPPFTHTHVSSTP